MQSKFGGERKDSIPESKRFVACLDITNNHSEPVVYFFPASIVAKGLKYHFNGQYPNSKSLNFSLDKLPVKKKVGKTVGEFINAEKYRENYSQLKFKKAK